MKKSVTMQHAPSEVFHYTDTRGHSDTILSKSCTILQAAKKDLLGIIQLQVRARGQEALTGNGATFSERPESLRSGIKQRLQGEAAVFQGCGSG